MILRFDIRSILVTHIALCETFSKFPVLKLLLHRALQMCLWRNVSDEDHNRIVVLIKTIALDDLRIQKKVNNGGNHQISYVSGFFRGSNM